MVDSLEPKPGRYPDERCETCGSWHDGCSVDVCPYGVMRNKPGDPAKPEMTANEVADSYRHGDVTEEELEEAMDETTNFVELLRCAVPQVGGEGQLVINKPLAEAVLAGEIMPTYADLFVRVTYYKHDENGNVEMKDGSFLEEVIDRFVTSFQVWVSKRLAGKTVLQFTITPVSEIPKKT